MRPALLLLALLLVPTAVAGLETYSHRVVVTGRVVDRDGSPAPGLTVSLDAEAQLGGACFDTHDVTDGTGDFALCRYARELPATLDATLRVGNVTRAVRIDGATRHGAVAVQLDEARAGRDLAGDRAFARTVRIAGRIFLARAGGADVDGVHVPAVALEGLSVAVSAGGLAANTTTNDQGDYTIDLPLAGVPASVRVEAGGRVATAEIDATLRRADVVLLLEATPTRPGSGSPRIPDASWAGIVAVALMVSVASRRRR